MYPESDLVQGTDGFLYGTTVQNGSNTDDAGTVFRIDTLGNVTPLHIFTGADGANPYSRLIQSGDRNFYGTTLNGGTQTLALSSGWARQETHHAPFVHRR